MDCTNFFAAPIKEIKIDGNVFKGWKLITQDGAKFTYRLTDGHYRNSTFDVTLEDGEELKLEFVDRVYDIVYKAGTTEIDWYQKNCRRHGHADDKVPDPKFAIVSGVGEADKPCPPKVK